jgi:hypothetical protein
VRGLDLRQYLDHLNETLGQQPNLDLARLLPWIEGLREDTDASHGLSLNAVVREPVGSVNEIPTDIAFKGPHNPTQYIRRALWLRKPF